MSISEMRSVCPDVIIINSDYGLYEEYSRRMNAIVKRYTTKVESYSIDEVFADITGMDALMRMSYEEIASRIKRDLESELGITFSVGVSITKTLAKMASSSNKPSGLAIVDAGHIDELLVRTPIEKVWGIGRRTSVKLVRQGMVTALDFAQKQPAAVARSFSKPYQQLQYELKGVLMHEVSYGTRRDYLSVSKTRMFPSPSRDEAYVFSQLSNNIEKACRALRTRGMFGRKVSIFLKTQKFTYAMSEFVLPYSVATPGEILKYAKRHFHTLFEKGVTYRAAGITVSQLSRVQGTTLNLFSENVLSATASRIYESVDALNHRYGRETIFLGSSLGAVKRSGLRRLCIPSLGTVS